MGKYSREEKNKNKNSIVAEGCKTMRFEKRKTNRTNRKRPPFPNEWNQMIMMMVQFLIPTCKSPTTICIGWLCKTIVLIVVDASADADDDVGCAVASYLLIFAAEEESILFLFYSVNFFILYLHTHMHVFVYVLRLYYFYCCIKVIFVLCCNNHQNKIKIPMDWINILFTFFDTSIL